MHVGVDLISAEAMLNWERCLRLSVSQEPLVLCCLWAVVVLGPAVRFWLPFVPMYALTSSIRDLGSFRPIVIAIVIPRLETCEHGLIPSVLWFPAIGAASGHKADSQS